jgi:hypothetical protein
MGKLSGCLALAAMVAFGVPRAPAGKAHEEAAARLVRQLGSRKYSEREAAARQLEALGEPALPALRRVVSSGDLEVRRRAESLIARIEQRAETARLLAGRRVRLVYKNTSPLNALDELAARTGFDLRIDGTPPAERPITLDTGETTPWEALRQFCRAAGLSELGLQPDEDLAGSTIRLTAERVEAPPTHLAGAVRFRALPLVSAKEAPAGARGFLLEATPEPGMPWLGVAGVRITRALDDRGQRLSQPALANAGPPLPPRPPDRPRAWDALSGQPVAAPVDRRALPVWLVPGKQPATRLREVQGRLVAQVPVSRQLLAVDNVLKAEGKTIEGTQGQSLKILKATRTAESLRLHVRLKRLGSGGTVFQVTRTPKGTLVMRGGQNGPPFGFALQDAGGSLLPLLTSRQLYLPNHGGGGLVMEFQLTFALKSGQPLPERLVCRGPVPTLLEVPFTLRDVPLSAAPPAGGLPSAKPSPPR